MPKLCEHWTIDDVARCWEESGNNMRKAAALLSDMVSCDVSPQLMRYWVSKLDVTETTIPYESVREQQRSRTAMTENNKLRKQNREALDSLAYYQNLELMMQDIVDQIQVYEPQPVARKRSGRKAMHVEALFSDLQIGKLAPGYDSEVAKARVKGYCEALICKVLQHQENYDVTGITLALLGDIIESDKKHIGSARACDIGTADQLKQAAESLIFDLIMPLAALGIPMTVICVTGNHDHDGHGINMYMPGQEHLSWPMFHCLRMVVERSFKNVEFKIPRGCFYVHGIFNNTILYEHGVGVRPNPVDMERRRDQRAQQIGRHINMFRQGDKHNICRFNNDSLIVNGAFFGTDAVGGEYSAIIGFKNAPAQLVLFHVQREQDDPRSTIYDSFAIQLGHVNG